MDRREALKAVSLILGYSLTGTSALVLLNGCKAESNTDWAPNFFSEAEIKLIAEIAEIILPKTDTPGAKDAMCERYVDEAVFLFYKKEDQQKFKKDLTVFDDYAKNKFSKAFMALNQNEKEKILEIVVKSMLKNEKDQKNKSHIFNKLKELTISGYCTSEVGTKGGLLEYRPVPGPYQGCIDYISVGKTWAL
ncbi:MAG: gluconate 2-dehydrogenase subunit 3 family protein [Saprospiraceae bacterium]|nr:gluconate 2-dehydrogenase subunit 3 family protein [Saprospiraceae bacterium]